MIDPFVAVAPILVLPIVGLLRYIGCILQTGGIPGSDVTVTVNPPQATVKPNETATFTATVTGALQDQGVSWSLMLFDADSPGMGPGIGTFTFPNPSTTLVVLYQAPTASSLSNLTTPVTITASTIATALQASVSGSATITVTDNP
jgi:hypothetical protein